MKRVRLCGLNADEIFHLIEPSGYTRAHAVAIANSIYKKNVSEISQILKIPGKLKDELTIDTSIGIFKPIVSQVSVDNTVKYLFRTEDEKEFETVYIPDKKRVTVCLSTQSGCRMGCSFCATANYGYHGNLTSGEIVNQIISLPESGSVTHVVFMGMGEPMDNFDNVIKASEIITSEWGLSISPRNVTVSSVGITPGVEKFLDRSSCNLTISLHSPFTEERKMIVPAEKLYPVQRIIEILKKYPVRKKRRLSIAYVMIRDLNDSDAHLEGLKALIKGSEIRVNLIPYHPIRNDKHISSSIEKMTDFKHKLVISGISASIRKSRGSDISAACGLLATGLK